MTLPARYLLPRMPTSLEGVEQLALDMHWSWSHSADAIWRRINDELWQRARNPWLILVDMSDARLQQLAADQDFVDLIKSEAARYRAAASEPDWFNQQARSDELGQVAYFCMEFGLCEALPIYSGGLGMLAGDTLKTASDLGLPLTGVGLLYQQGYFRQVLDGDGRQHALYPYNDPIQLPVAPLRGPDGAWLRVQIALPGRRLRLQVWEARVGRVRLLLLDSNDPLNLPANRAITSELYGGSLENRLQQERILGIGGWRALRAIGLDPSICHLNEGHAAFVVLERARGYMARHGGTLAEALTVTRVGNLFTTHTPVSAGFDQFPPTLVSQQLTAYATELGVGIDELLMLGGTDPRNQTAPFNMALLATRGSGAINGASRLHGTVSRQLFQPLFPRWPQSEVPIGHVTNGIHVPSWDSPEADRFWTDSCGKERWRGDLQELTQSMERLPDEAFWSLRNIGRQRLVHYIRQRLAEQPASGGIEQELAIQAGEALDPDALTLCFARRFATYKRPNLLLHDPARLAALLSNPQYPVQLVIAGKAHPSDQPGQALIQQWIQFIHRYGLHGRMVFLVDYDILVAEQLVQGADVWINTPRRPWEASGTSGMKILVNGGLNLSELDGWWAEAYRPDVGWAIGDRHEHDSDPAWDAADADQLYALMEREIVPGFYQRDARGIPAQWVHRVRTSISTLTPRFSTNRMLRDYLQEYYLPAARAQRRRRVDNGAIGRELPAWRSRVTLHWQGLHWDQLRAYTDADGHHVSLHLYLDDLGPDDVRLECFADPLDDRPAERHALQRGAALAGAINGFVYTGLLPAEWPLSHYTPRILPNHPEALVPLELNLITWIEGGFRSDS